MIREIITLGIGEHKLPLTRNSDAQPRPSFNAHIIRMCAKALFTRLKLSHSTPNTNELG